MSVVVFIDTRGDKLPKAAQEALTYGKHIAAKLGGGVTAVTFGDGANLEGLGAFGATKVVVAKGVKTIESQQLTKLVADTATTEKAQVIVCVHDGTGKACLLYTSYA